MNFRKAKRADNGSFCFWLGWQDSTVCRAAPGILPARDTPRFACGTALALPAKNVPPAHFINAETFSGSNPFTFPKSKKSRQRLFLLLAGVAGFEPTNAAVKVLCLTA